MVTVCSLEASRAARSALGLERVAAALRGGRCCRAVARHADDHLRPVGNRIVVRRDGGALAVRQPRTYANRLHGFAVGAERPQCGDARTRLACRALLTTATTRAALT